MRDQDATVLVNFNREEEMARLLEQAYSELGKAYYEGGFEDPLPQLLPLFERITNLKNELENLKAAAAAPVPEPVAEPAPQPEIQPAPQPEIQPEPVAEPAPQPEVQPEPVAEPAPQPEIQPAPVPEPAPQPEIQPAPRWEPAPQPEIQPAPRWEPAPMPDRQQAQPLRPGEYKFCIYCGSPLEPGDIFCSNCGRRLG